MGTKSGECEKLELLSRTAVLKQGIDGNGTADDQQQQSASSRTVVLNSSNRVFVVGTNANIPSPVSSDGEDEDLTNITAIAANSRTTHIDTSAGISRSDSLNRTDSSSHHNNIGIPIPTTTADYRQCALTLAPHPSSLPSSPYGNRSLVDQQQQKNRHLSHHTQQVNHQQDYPSSYPYHQQHHHNHNYHHHQGNIIRTLSEASIAYGIGSIPTNSQASKATVPLAANNNGEYESNNLYPPLPPPPPQMQQSQHRHQHQQQQQPYEEMARQIRRMQEQLHEKDMVVSSLQHRVNFLENQNHELRQLPTGKFSHIPVDDMIRIMQEYGSESSNQTLPQQRKNSIKKTSIVRQFRRWNPEFFSFFLHVNGEWVPKLGRDGELRRRAEKRRLFLTAKQSQQQAQEGK